MTIPPTPLLDAPFIDEAPPGRGGPLRCPLCGSLIAADSALAATVVTFAGPAGLPECERRLLCIDCFAVGEHTGPNPRRPEVRRFVGYSAALDC